MVWQGFATVSDRTIAELHRRIASNRLELPLYESALQDGILSAAWKAVAPFVALDREAMLRLLESIQHERARQRPAPIELVWTGPEPQASTARDTVMVMQDLFSRARSDVFIAGYTFDNGKEILAPLHAVMQQHGVTATIVMNIRAAAELGAERAVEKATGNFWRANWPGAPRPALYHDPRTSNLRLMASMHAKAVIADARYCLVGSANFTRRGLARNIEMGVLVDSPELAKQILAHWRALIQGGSILPVPALN